MTSTANATASKRRGSGRQVQLLDAAWTALTQRPALAFAGMLFTFGLLWTVAQVTLFASPRRDAVEIIAFGPFWPMGIYKHPAFPIWLQEIAMRLSGDWVPSSYVLAVLCVVVTLVFIWALAKEMAGPVFATLATALSLGNLHLLEPVTQFNHDLVSLPLWAAAIYLFRQGVVFGRTATWLIFGLVATAIVLSKYSGILLLGTLAIYMLCTPEGRAGMRRPGPWLAVAVCVFALAPHVSWLFAVDFLPFKHPLTRRVSEAGMVKALWFGASFVLQQALNHLPMLVLVAVALGPWGSARRATENVTIARPEVSRFDANLALVATLGPMLGAVIWIVISRSDPRGMWGTAMFPMSAIAVLLLLRRVIVVRRPRAVAALWLGLLLVTPWAVSLAPYALPLVTATPHPAPQLFPARQLAEALAARWNAEVKERPLRFLVAPAWSGPAVASYLRPRPLVIQGGNPLHSPPFDPADLKASGALLLWQVVADIGPEIPPFYRPFVPEGTQVGEPIVVRHLAWGTEPFRFGWAIVPPSGDRGPR